MKYTKLLSLTAVFNKHSSLTKLKDSLISDATDKITCFSSKYEHSTAAEYVAAEKALVSPSSCSHRREVIKDNQEIIMHLKRILLESVESISATILLSQNQILHLSPFTVAENLRTLSRRKRRKERMKYGTQSQPFPYSMIQQTESS